ncbi:MAG: cyclase family protein [SAR202 cluster bacterium]|jgi:arylformamidase|nr:cyclase family protein [SAR202 cluster bacterium]
MEKGGDDTMWDVTLALSSKVPTYLGDPSFKRRLVQAIANGKTADVSLLTLSAHIGTHVDAPSHLFEGGKTVDELDLEVMLGTALVVEFIGQGPITMGFLEKCDIAVSEERVLFKTHNSSLWDRPEFQNDYVGLTVDAADWLIDNGARLVGIDYLSIDAPGNLDLSVHRTLLDNEIVVVEGLDLRQVSPGRYKLVCLPMKIEGSEGAPARVILLPE